MKCYKGFNNKLQCQPKKNKAPFQFEVGKTYAEDKADLCHSGFHACENPMDVLTYYAPADSRYCVVDLDDVNRGGHSDDSKVCGKKIHIEAEIGLKGIIEAGVKFIMDKVNFDNTPATNTGYQSAATVKGEESVAVSVGCEGKASGNIGSWIVLAEWAEREDGKLHRTDVKCIQVDGEKIKADTFYYLKNGEFVEVE